MPGAQQRADHREVAPPQRAADLQSVKARLGAKPQGFQLAIHRFGEAGLRNIVHGLTAKGVQRRGASPAGRLGMRQQAQMQRGEVAVAHPARALLHASLQERPVQTIQQSTETITSTAGHGHGWCRLRHAVDGGQTHLVRAGKALVACSGGLVDLDLEAQACQTLGGQAQLRRARHDARGGKNGQGSHELGGKQDAAGAGFLKPEARRRSAKNSRSMSPLAWARRPPSTVV